MGPGIYIWNVSVMKESRMKRFVVIPVISCIIAKWRADPLIRHEQRNKKKAGVAERINAFACKADVWGFDSSRRRVRSRE